MPGLLYLAFCAIGMALAHHYSHHSTRFFWREYLSIIAPVLLGLVGLYFLVGIKVLYVFLFFSFFGPLIEWLFGRVYHSIVGSHLWIYERYALPGRYTSWLTMPIWGAGIVVIWLMFRYF